MELVRAALNPVIVVFAIALQIVCGWAIIKVTFISLVWLEKAEDKLVKKIRG